MTVNQLQGLKEGDIVRNARSGLAYVVIHNDGKTIIAVRTLTITNPPEWTLVKV